MWPGLTLTNATKYRPSSKSTIMRHLVKNHQGVRSTKPNPPPPSSPEELMTQVRSNELFLQVAPISKLYTDNTSRFTVRSRSGHQYAMIAHHCDANLILAVPFNTRKDTHLLKAYNKIMQRLVYHKLCSDLKKLDNEASVEYKQVINENWKIITS